MTVGPLNIPVLDTENLILRGPREDDFEAVVRFAASDRTRFIGGKMDRWQAWRVFLAGFGHWALRGYGMWVLADRETGEVAGRVGFINHDGWSEPELGWHVYDGFEGRGYAYEAAVAARDAGPRLFGLDGVISHIDPANTRSRRLAERLGAWVERENVLLDKPILIYRHPKVLA